VDGGAHRRHAVAAPTREGIGAVSAAVFAVTAMFVVWQVWTPSPIGASDAAAHPTPGDANFAALAHAEPLPNGELPRFHPKNTTVPWFPTTPIKTAVERRLGPEARPLTVSANEKLFAFLPWPAYVAVARLSSNTYTHWDDRVAELRTLSRLTDPAAFAAASGATRFGRIDVFVLNGHASYWGWGPLQFNPRLFNAAYWWVEQLPNSIVVAVRR
jgi:hypothetical protein